MACPTDRPFSSDEAFRIVHELQQPAVFLNMTRDWPVLQWTAEHLSHCLQDKPIKFRLGRKEETKKPQFETQCCFVEATLGQFLRWTEGRTEAEDVGPFCGHLQGELWAYADYKYIAEVFHDQPHMFQDVRWSDFGFRGRGGRESTLWIGTEGANTPCHLDSYGCNLVLQVQGRKRWHLFPPEDTSKLYPTRIPYEESSVFSRVHVLNPDLTRFEDFREARRHCVTLQPGQVLLVPRHWWHYVESLDPVTVSVNSWIELDVDDEARIGEAVTRAVVFAFKSAPSDADDDDDNWLNPTETGVTSRSENMQYLNQALSSFSQRHSTDQPPPPRPPRPPPPPFGPHLVPVKPPSSPEPRSCKRKCEEPEADTGADVGGLQGPLRQALGTNELLDCLLHPDVIQRVTQLLIQRHTGARRKAHARVFK